jgi:hypothetical protein
MLHLDETTWRARSRAHAERADALTAGHRARRERHEAHPVEDFLFTYYPTRPNRLRVWHPGAGVVLENAVERAGWKHYSPDGNRVDATTIRPATIAFVRGLLAATAARPAHLGCFGLHEWAMVYREPADSVRHAQVPLRLGSAGTDTVVESLDIRCGHYDAFRFFTDPARPRNGLAPSRENQVELEQPGCLHANMDLFKWAYKLDPFVPAELVGDCFELAADIRALDMRASPYDLAAYGYPAVRIETAEGRAEYARFQAAFARRAEPLRAQLISLCRHLLGRES